MSGISKTGIKTICLLKFTQNIGTGPSQKLIIRLLLFRPYFIVKKLRTKLIFCWNTRIDGRIIRRSYFFADWTLHWLGFIQILSWSLSILVSMLGLLTSKLLRKPIVIEAAKLMLFWHGKSIRFSDYMWWVVIGLHSVLLIQSYSTKRFNYPPISNRKK